MNRRQLGREGPERLGKIAILAELSVGRRRELAQVADEVFAQAGEMIMRQGEPGYEFMMLEEGHADVLQDGERINVIGPGDCFGELSVLSDGQPRSASLVATSDLRAIVLTARFMREMHDRLPSAGERIDRLAVERTEHDARRESVDGVAGRYACRRLILGTGRRGTTMNLLPLLIVTVLGIGGPPHHPPSRLTDGVITVRHDGHMVTHSTTGRLERRLHSGRYRVSGTLPERAAVGRNCEVKWVQLHRGHTDRIEIYCQIK